MSDFIGKSHELIQNLMGTDHLPVFLKCMPGKASSGYTFYHKIGANYYAAYKTRTCKKFMHIKCKNYRQGCSWTGRIKNISGILDETDQQYWIGDNKWISLPNHSAKSHTCNPLDFNKLCQNDFRNFVNP